MAWRRCIHHAIVFNACVKIRQAEKLYKRKIKNKTIPSISFTPSTSFNIKQCNLHLNSDFITEIDIKIIEKYKMFKFAWKY